MILKETNTKNPVISVITVCYNCSNTIEGTIKSVLEQQYPFIEYIIIDGGSTDGTQEIVKKYSEKINVFVSEKDSGIYDAMNKGLALAQGDIIFFLNSGDCLHSAFIFNEISEYSLKNPDSNLLLGDIINYDGERDVFCSMKRENNIQYFTYPICHQALFAKKKVFDKIGGFNMQYSIFADRDWIFRAVFVQNFQITHIPITVCKYLMGGFSTNRNEKFHRERIHLFSQYCSNSKFLYQLVKKPIELIHVIGLILFSTVNVILKRIVP